MEAPMSASKLPFWPALLCLSAAACSDGEITASRPAPIEQIPGGGTRGEPLEKELGLVALDARTDAPIVSAQIWLGEGTSAKAVGTTDENGELRVSEVELKDTRAGGSSVAITAVKSGFVTTAYVGIDRDTATIALRPEDESVEKTAIRVHVQGFEPLPRPAAGEYWLGTAAVSRGTDFLDDDLSSARTEPPAPTCRWVNNITSCVLTVSASAGKHTLFALVAKGRDAGTPSDPSDDTLEVTGINAQALDVTLDRPDDLVGLKAVGPALTALAVVPSAAPAGMDKVIGVPGINRSGDVMVFPALPAAVSDWAVPVNDQEFAGEVLWGVATASSTDGTQRARVVQRGVMAPPSPEPAPIDVSTPTFLEAPSVSMDGTALAVAPPSGASIHRLKLRRGGALVMDIVLLGGATRFTPPSSLSDPGPADAEISSLESSQTSEDLSVRQAYLELKRDSSSEKRLDIP